MMALLHVCEASPLAYGNAALSITGTCARAMCTYQHSLV